MKNIKFGTSFKFLALIWVSPLYLLFNTPNSELKPLLTCPAPYEKTQAKTEPFTVKVMTYNIRHGRDLNSKSNLDRIATLIKDEHIDVISLQEVDMKRFRTNYELQAKYLAKKLNYYYQFARARKLKKGGEYGNAILSRFPIKDAKRIRLPKGSPNRPGRFESRTLLSVQILPDRCDSNKNFIFISTHLGIYDDKLNDPNQGLTAKKIIDHVTDLEKLNLPIILAGDLNIPHRKLTLIKNFDFVQGNILSNLSLKFKFEPYNEFKANQIDYILYSHNSKHIQIQSWDIIDEPGTKKNWRSDHLARVSVFNFSPLAQE